MTQATIEKTEVPSSAPVARDESRKGIGTVAFKKSRAFGEFCVFLVVGLLLLELIFKFAGICDEENYLVDKRVGWVPVPNRSATYRTEGFSRYTINSLGMRDKERTIAKPPNTFRIAVMGCSVTEGKEVFIDQTYCSLLEKQLNQQGGPVKYEVLNFAVAAYNLGQEYLRLKHFALQFKPDLVVFTVRPNALLYMGGKAESGLFSSPPLFAIQANGELLEDHHVQNHWLSTREGQRAQKTVWLSTHSRLYKLIGKCAYNLEENRKKLGRKPVALKKDAEDKAEVKKRMENAQLYLSKVAGALVADAKALCDKEQAEFMVLYLPFGSKYRSALEGTLIENFCKQQNVKFADCNPDFDQLQKTSRKELYLRAHPSKFGHEKIAEYLKSYLERNGLLKTGVSTSQNVLQ